MYETHFVRFLLKYVVGLSVFFLSLSLVCSCFVRFLKKTPIKISPRAQTKSRIRSIWNFISGKANVSTRLIVKFVGRHNINRSAYYSTKVHILLKCYSFFVWSSYVAFLCGSYGFFLISVSVSSLYLGQFFILFVTFSVSNSTTERNFRRYTFSLMCFFKWNLLHHYGKSKRTQS